MKPHKNIKSLVEAILTSNTAVEARTKLDNITWPTFRDACKDLLGLFGEVNEMKDALITTAKENPDSELANIIRIIDPSILPQKVEMAPVKWPECGQYMKVSRPILNKPNASNGLPFLASQNYLRAKGRM